MLLILLIVDNLIMTWISWNGILRKLNIDDDDGMRDEMAEQIDSFVIMTRLSMFGIIIKIFSDFKSCTNWFIIIIIVNIFYSIIELCSGGLGSSPSYSVTWIAASLLSHQNYCQHLFHFTMTIIFRGSIDRAYLWGIRIIIKLFSEINSCIISL